MDSSGGLRVQTILIVSFPDLYTFKYKSKNGSFDTLVLCQNVTGEVMYEIFSMLVKTKK